MTREEKLEKVFGSIEEETNFEVIKEMKTILNKVFGEEYNQIIKPSIESITGPLDIRARRNLDHAIENLTLDPLKSWLRRNIPYYSDYQIIVYFPELIITDGRHKHPIKELYVRAHVKPSGTMSTNISGTRSFLTRAEARGGYVHSHLPMQSIDNFGFHGFCTGEGPIQQVLLMLSSKFTIPNFMLFCLHLKNYVVWESREGRPYMYINEIGKRSDNDIRQPERIYDNTAMSAADILFQIMKKANFHTKHIYDMFEFKVSPLEIEVTPKREFENWAGQIIRGLDTRRLLAVSNPIQSFLSHVDNSGRYHPVMIAPSEISYDKEKILVQFKGQDVKLKIESSNETTQNKINETVPERRITDYFCKEFSRLLTDAAFINVRVKTCSAGTDITETTESDPVHVQGSVDSRVVGDALL